MFIPLRPILTKADLSLGYVLELELQWGTALICAVGMVLKDLSPFEPIGGKLKSLGRETLVGAAAFGAMLLIDVLLAALLPLGPHHHEIRRLPQSAFEVILLAMIAISAGITEEYIFRGYLLRQFSVLGGGKWVAMVLQALIFTLAHGYDQGIFSFADKFVFAMLMAWLTQERRTLIPAIVCHALNDFVLMMGLLVLLR